MSSGGGGGGTGIRKEVDLVSSKSPTQKRQRSDKCKRRNMNVSGAAPPSQQQVIFNQGSISGGSGGAILFSPPYGKQIIGVGAQNNNNSGEGTKEDGK